MKKKLQDVEFEEIHAKSLVPKTNKLSARPQNKKQFIPKNEHLKFLFLIVFSLSTTAIIALSPTLLPSVLISILLFFIFRPITDSLERRGMSRRFVISAIFLVCGIAVTLITTKFVPRITLEVESFQQGSSRYGTQLEERLRYQEQKFTSKMPMFKNLELTDKGVQWLKKVYEKIWKIAPSIASHLLIALFLVPFLTVIFLRDGNEIRRRLLSMVPNRYFETFYSISFRIVEEMGGYVAAKIIEAFMVATLVSVGCFALKIPYAILLGVFAGLTNPIPYIGPIIGAIPGLLLAVLEPAVHNHLMMIGVIYMVANVVDMFIIFPMVVAKIVNLHPVIVVMAVVFGSQVFGVLGMIVAVPIASILKILIQEAYSRIYSVQASTDHY